MSNSGNRKPIPRSILIFGAAAHIGGPLARFLQREAPQIQLRLASSRPEMCDKLRREYPDAETVLANYYDPPSLEAAVQGMEGLFVIATGATDEERAMTNLVAALKKSGSAVHILRFLGFEPEANIRRVPPLARGMHLAKQLLDESDLPVTYLNCGASFMDNLVLASEGLRTERKFVWHDRLVPYIDPRDIAEVAGRLFLSDNHRHLYQLHTMNNGHDLLRGSDVAALVGKVLGETITFESNKEAFVKAYPQFGVPDLVWDFLEYEEGIEVVWARNDFVERTLGRKPVTLEQWITEHAQLLRG